MRSGSKGNSDAANEHVIADALKFEPVNYEWRRHPVGFILPSEGDLDFHLYTEYNPLVAVERLDLAGMTGPSSTVTPGRDEINCLTCHRSHGTQGTKHLRWDPLEEGGSCTNSHKSKTHISQEYYLCSEIKDCNFCHTSHGHSDRLGLEPFGPDENKELVWEKIWSPVEEVYRDVTFPILDNERYRFVRADTPPGAGYDGICEVCHTLTDYWLNDGGQPLSGYGGPGAGEQCTDCHIHEHEFAGAPDDTGHNTHTSGTARGPDPLDCDGCHLGDPALKVFLDNQNLTDTSMCNGCHSEGGAFDGPAMAKANYAGGVYNPDGTLKAGMENWCLACHDIDQACSDYDCTGVLAPIIAGDNTNYGFYANGHGLGAGSNYQLMYYQEGSGTGNPGAGLICTDCHDSEADHFDPGELTRLKSGFQNDQNKTNCNQCHPPGTTAIAPPELYTTSAE